MKGPSIRPPTTAPTIPPEFAGSIDIGSTTMTAAAGATVVLTTRCSHTPVSRIMRMFPIIPHTFRHNTSGLHATHSRRVRHVASHKRVIIHEVVPVPCPPCVIIRVTIIPTFPRRVKYLKSSLLDHPYYLQRIVHIPGRAGTCLRPHPGLSGESDYVQR